MADRCRSFLFLMMLLIFLQIFLNGCFFVIQIRLRKTLELKESSNSSFHPILRAPVGKFRIRNTNQALSSSTPIESRCIEG